MKQRGPLSDGGRDTAGLLAGVNVLTVVLWRLCIRSERGDEAKTQAGLKMCKIIF